MPIPSVIETEPGTLPARERVLATVRNWIIDGDLAPGEIIRDAEIADALNVSRTPVREALLQLRSESLVEMKPKGWTQVKLLDLREAEKLLPVVVDLEALASRLAAENPRRYLTTAEQAQRDLVALVEHSGRPPSAEEAQEILQANDAFHIAVAEIADNPFLVNALLPLKALMRRYERIYFGRATVIDEASLREHDLIIEAIRRGDGDEAARLAISNFSNSPFAIGTNGAR
ncbi:MAG: GntR family transcriptional regulator [Vicinamibacterales bacterium]